MPIEVVQDPGDKGHNDAAAIGVERARGLGAIAAALLPGDCPLLDPEELATAINGLDPKTVLVIPDRFQKGFHRLRFTRKGDGEFIKHENFPAASPPPAASHPQVQRAAA